ncbi:hypothetical protein BLOT_009013 [Blomia tropicalis]|nr:hypothetical protein BLOT_009013 [Blomia tropicalis]
MRDQSTFDIIIKSQNNRTRLKWKKGRTFILSILSQHLMLVISDLYHRIPSCLYENFILDR